MIYFLWNLLLLWPRVLVVALFSSPLPPLRGPALLGPVAGVPLLGLAAGHGLHARAPL